VSYSLIPYIVDLDKVKSAINSGDKELLAKVLQKSELEDDFDPSKSDEEENDVDDEDDDDDEEDEPSLGRTVGDLILGRKRVDGAGFQYGYALEQLCNYFGTIPDGDNWCGIRWEVMEATGADVLLVASGSPVKLPEIDDFPTIGFLSAQEVQKAAQSIGAEGLTTAAPEGKKITKTLVQKVLGPVFLWLLRRMTGSPRRADLTPEDKKSLLSEYEQWLKQAASAKQGIVFFYY
jgi:hypothetical protein